TRFLTSYKPGVVPEAYWAELAQTNDTLVFYMSSEKLDDAVEKLIENNIASDKWLAVIEQATTPLQRVHTCTVQDYLRRLGGQTYLSPSLVIVGTVVALHEQFAWLANNQNVEEYFDPVTGKWIAANEEAARA
ncbi:MAG TPA: SAM-dependent methyltransferase, partial [Ferruginibacter sp.]|nr:SAM-dependent methyltransferase [Ferruginibacter sp.]